MPPHRSPHLGRRKARGARNVRVAVMMAATAASWGPAAAVAGQDSCVASGEIGRNNVLSAAVPGLGRVTYISKPHFVCEQGSQIWADSAVVYEERSLSEFMGSFRYLDGDRELLADEARYFYDLGRLQASGNMTLSDEAQGSSITNGDLVLLLENDIRDEESMMVTTGADGRRPEAVLTPPPDSIDTDAEPGPPYTVLGDRIDLRGASSFVSVGDVRIVRDALLAFGDSVEYDTSRGGLRLEGAARVEGEGYDLEGRAITMDSPGSEESAVRALRDARLTGDDLLLTSSLIIVFMKDDALERLVAVRLADPNASNASDTVAADSADSERPEATVDDFVLTADSLEVSAPGEIIERVFAAGAARSTSGSRDTLNVALLPEIARTDWLEGDTIIVSFREPSDAEAEDGGGREVEEIIALGSARSLYRLEPSDTTARIGTDPPAVHYVTGDEIRITMAAGEVDGMAVRGGASGVHLEPLRRVAATTTDTIQPDTILPDTVRSDTIPRDTIRSDASRAPDRLERSVDAARRGAPAHDDSRDTRPIGADDTPREEKPWTLR